ADYISGWARNEGHLSRACLTKPTAFEWWYPVDGCLFLRGRPDCHVENHSFMQIPECGRASGIRTLRHHSRLRYCMSGVIASDDAIGPTCLVTLITWKRSHPSGPAHACDLGHRTT